jgi:diguanylate cyclase (GGDEF)-like protein/PAS domain S-box-containing protein
MDISKARSLKFPQYISNRNLFHSSIVLVLIFWLIESLLHIYVFDISDHGHTVFESFFPDEPNELWMRIIISMLLLLLGFLVDISIRYIKNTNTVNREILENSTNAYLVVNRNWIVEYLNSEAERLFDLTRSKDLGKVLSDILPDLACSFYKPFKDSMDNQKVGSMDGFDPQSDKWLKVHVYPNSTGISVTVQDISLEKYYQERMQRKMAIIDNSLDGLISINRLGIVQTYSKAAESIFGYKHNEVVGNNISMLMPENHARHHDGYISQYLKTGNAKLVGIGPYEVQAKHKDGSLFDMDLAINEAVVNDEIIFIANVRNISQRKGLQRKLEYLSNYDSLTGLPNRSLLMDSLKQSIKTATRHNNRLAVMFLDLNDFKQTNDSFGHNVGDQLLVTVANYLKDCLRESDMVARLSGDEFVIILEDVKHADDATIVANKILEKFSIAISIGEHKIKAGTSIGIALFPDDGRSQLELLKHADAAMYLAKKSGDEHFRYYSGISKKGASAPEN